MRYGSVCSGIEAATVAWHPLGWEPVFFSEIERFPAAVLAHHYPSTPNLGDMTQHRTWNHAAIDLLVGGTPCQSFSAAGLRKGLADPRGNLALEYLALADRTRPRWLVWENVPGVLSSTGGRDFGSFLGALAELGYGWAYRVLDAQFYGVAQRRRRVFVVGHSGSGWAAPAAVLFERESLRGDPAPSRAQGQRPAATLRASTPGASGLSTDHEHVTTGVGGELAHCLRGNSYSAGEDGDGRGIPLAPIRDVAPTLDATMERKFGSNQWVDRGQWVLSATGTQANAAFSSDVAGTLNSMDNDRPYVFDPNQITSKTNRSNPAPAVLQPMVRKLTEIECERLQGFPDDYTRIPYRGKPATECPRGPRYKALGNSMAVPVMRWIGERIQMVDKLLDEIGRGEER